MIKKMAGASVTIGELIMTLITNVVGLSLVPQLAQQIGIAQADPNVTGASVTLLGMLLIVNVSVIIGWNVAILRRAFRRG